MKQTANGKLLYRHRELNLALCDNLEGCAGVRGGERFRTEEAYMYFWLIHVVVWQKPTQYCKAIILQFKKIKKNYTSILKTEFKSTKMESYASYTMEILNARKLVVLKYHIQ